MDKVLPVVTIRPDEGEKSFTFSELASWALVLLEEEPKKYQFTLQFLKKIYEEEYGKTPKSKEELFSIV